MAHCACDSAIFISKSSRPPLHGVAIERAGAVSSESAASPDHRVKTETPGAGDTARWRQSASSGNRTRQHLRVLLTTSSFCVHPPSIVGGTEQRDFGKTLRTNQ